MATIGQNLPNIQEKYENKRAQNDAKKEEIQNKTENAKQEAIENAKSAFEEINANNSDTLTGAIAEGVKDFGGFVMASIDAKVASDIDLISDIATEMQDAIYDVQSHRAEFVESAGSVLSDVGAGVKGVFKGIGDSVSGWFQQGLDEKYEE